MLKRSDSADFHAGVHSKQLQLWSMAPAGSVPLRLYIGSIDVCTCPDRGGNSLKIILVNLQARAKLQRLYLTRFLRTMPVEFVHGGGRPPSRTEGMHRLGWYRQGRFRNNGLSAAIRVFNSNHTGKNIPAARRCRPRGSPTTSVRRGQRARCADHSKMDTESCGRFALAHIRDMQSAAPHRSVQLLCQLP